MPDPERKFRAALSGDDRFSGMPPLSNKALETFAASAGQAGVQVEREILDVIEQEQLRIAQELHDTICQSLSGLRLSTAALRRKHGATAGGGLMEEFTRIDESAGKSVGELHDLIQSLQPVEIQPSELSDALEGLAREICGAVRCEYRCVGRPVAEDVFTASQIYRIARAAVRCAARRETTKRISITWQEGPKGRVLAISTEPPALARTESSIQRAFGWKLLQRRAKAIGGELMIDPDGASVTLTLPLPSGTGSSSNPR